VFANYGKWFIRDYGMTPSTLGAVTVTIGVGEIVAELVQPLLSNSMTVTL
jgi:hypothetical protein